MLFYCSNLSSFGLGKFFKTRLWGFFLLFVFICFHSPIEQKVNDGGGREEVLERYHQIGEGIGSRSIMVG